MALNFQFNFEIPDRALFVMVFLCCAAFGDTAKLKSLQDGIKTQHSEFQALASEREARLSGRLAYTAQEIEKARLDFGLRELQDNSESLTQEEERAGAQLIDTIGVTDAQVGTFLNNRLLARQVGLQKKIIRDAFEALKLQFPELATKLDAKSAEIIGALDGFNLLEGIAVKHQISPRLFRFQENEFRLFNKTQLLAVLAYLKKGDWQQLEKGGFSDFDQANIRDYSHPKGLSSSLACCDRVGCQHCPCNYLLRFLNEGLYLPGARANGGNRGSILKILNERGRNRVKAK